MKKPLSEAETKKKLFNLAKSLGVAHEFKLLLGRYEDLMKKCTNVEERRHISIMGNIEIHKFFNFANPLVIDGVEILPAQPGWEEGKDDSSSN